MAGSATILVIDDDPAMRMIMSLSLKLSPRSQVALGNGALSSKRASPGWSGLACLAASWAVQLPGTGSVPKCNLGTRIVQLGNEDRNRVRTRRTFNGVVSRIPPRTSAAQSTGMASPMPPAFGSRIRSVSVNGTVPSARPKKILIVNPDLAVATVFQEKLEQEKFAVEVVGIPRLALRMSSIRSISWWWICAGQALMPPSSSTPSDRNRARKRCR